MKLAHTISFRPMQPEDWPAVVDIFKQGMEGGNATYDHTLPDWQSWNNNHISTCRLMALADNKIAGWVALSPVSGRCVFKGVAEVSIYISDTYKGMHIGSQLLGQLITESEKEGFWMLQSGIFPENEASIRLHEKAGFRLVGYREKIGKMHNGIWRDIVLLERRSKITGIA